jgi:hypothetical protein
MIARVWTGAGRKSDADASARQDLPEGMVVV